MHSGLSTTEAVNYTEAARKLWMLLDHIDTLDDACHGDDAAFRKHARDTQRKRFAILSGEQMDVLLGAAAGSAALPPPPPDPVYWQWRHTRDAWSTTFLFTSEPAVTAPDTEKRPLYAGPVIAFGVPPFDASKPCILTTDDPTRTLCLRCMNPHHACDHPAYGGTAAAVPHRESDSIGASALTARDVELLREIRVNFGNLRQLSADWRNEARNLLLRIEQAAAGVPESDSIGRTMRMEAVLFSAEAKAAYAAPLPAAAPKSGETPDQRPADGDGAQCPDCNGYGRVNDGSGARSPYGPKCPKCGGSGRVPAALPLPHQQPGETQMDRKPDGDA